jgi:hypothetical protein
MTEENATGTATAAAAPEPHPLAGHFTGGAIRAIEAWYAKEVAKLRAEFSRTTKDQKISKDQS